MSEAGEYRTDPPAGPLEALPFRNNEATFDSIKRRLAVVADELRSAAQTAGPSGEILLTLADKFEQQSRAEET